MAGFDANKYKAIFERRYGKGSFDAGLSDAKELGRKKAELEATKKLFNEYAKLRKEQEKRLEKAEKKEQDKIPVYGDIPAKEARSMQKKAQAQGRGGYQPTYDNRVKEAKATRKAIEKKELYPDFSKMTPYAREQYTKKSKKKEEVGFGGKIKDWFLSKDTNGDGDRDGLLGTIDRFVTPISKGATDFFIPGNTENMAKYNPDNPVIKAAQKDRGFETKALNAAGMFAAAATPYSKGYKVADAAFNRIPKLAKIANPYVQSAIKGAGAGAMAEAGISATNEIANPNAYSAKDYAIRSGIGAIGGGVLDPAFLKIGNIFRGATRTPTPTINTTPFSPRGRQLDETFERISQVPDNANRLPFAEQPMVRADDNIDYNGILRQQVASDLERLKPVGKSIKSLKLPKTTESPLGGNVFDINAGTLKDIDGFRGYTSDIYRNTRDVFGQHFPKVKKALLDPFDAAKKENVVLQENWVNKLEKDIVKGLGIKKGSKLSKLVQDYGEKTISLEQLKAAAPDDWKKVVNADKWFRKSYDELIDQVNASRMKVYPNNPDMLVPKRTDYYRHFRELNGFEGIRNIFDTPAGIDPHLVGTSDFTNPNSKWSSMMQRRGLGAYKSDAVGGFLNYLPAASYAIKIDPQIPKFKELTKTLKDATGATKNLNHYIEFLEDFTRDLSGKTNFLDRPVQKVLGRKTFNALQWMNNRVKKNAVLGNVGSMLAQVANVPNGVAFAKQHSVPGAMNTIKSLVTKNEAMAQSGFLKERFSQNMYQKFETRLIDQPEKFAGWAMTLADRVGTSFVWNSAYSKGIAEGVENPIKYADDATRNLVAGRGIGEVPLIQKSKVFQFIAPFQLEVANLWRVQKDFIKEKDFGALVTLYLGSWMLNKGMEEVRGSSVTFDPIDAIVDAFTDEDLNGWEKGGRLLGEVLSNVPLGQTAANFYPEYGTDHLPTREDFFGDRDPNRFGSGLLVAKGVQDPFAKLMLPFGGAQLQKTVKGLDAIGSEGVYNWDHTKLKYPIDTDPVNSIKGAVFGVGGFRETNDFYDNERMPLGTKQTAQYETLKNQGVGNEYYNQVMIKREFDRIEDEIKTTMNDASLSENERQRRISKLMELRNDLSFQFIE